MGRQIFGALFIALAYLLDTHALIWWWLGDPRLPESARNIMSAPTVPIYVSAISAYELALKVRTGELSELAEPLADFGDSVRGDGFRHLDVLHDHTTRAAMLSDELRDPFDRIIAAQALADQLTVLTRDRSIAAFGCRTLW